MKLMEKEHWNQFVIMPVNLSRWQMVLNVCIHMKGITYNKELIYIVGLNTTAT